MCRDSKSLFKRLSIRLPRVVKSPARNAENFPMYNPLAPEGPRNVYYGLIFKDLISTHYITIWSHDLFVLLLAKEQRLIYLHASIHL